MMRNGTVFVLQFCSVRQLPRAVWIEDGRVSDTLMRTTPDDTGASSAVHCQELSFHRIGISGQSPRADILENRECGFLSPLVELRAEYTKRNLDDFRIFTDPHPPSLSLTFLFSKLVSGSRNHGLPFEGG